MPAEDVQATRMVQRELVKRCIDTSLLDVRVSHGVVYLRGTVRRMRGYDFDLEREMAIICTILRQKPGIREVVNEAVIRQ
ncbi:MAG: BON domain-containing protein [Armatimonadota bacterium]